MPKEYDDAGLLAAFGNPMGAKNVQPEDQQETKGAAVVEQGASSFENLSTPGPRALKGCEASLDPADLFLLDFEEIIEQDLKPLALGIDTKVAALAKEVAHNETLLAANIRVHGALLSQLQAAMAAGQQLDQNVMDSAEITLEHLLLDLDDNLEPLEKDQPDHSMGAVGVAMDIADTPPGDMEEKLEFQLALNGEEQVAALEKKLEGLTVALASKIRENKGLYLKLDVVNQKIPCSNALSRKSESEKTAKEAARKYLGM